MKSQMYQKIEESTCHVASRKMVSNFAMKDENHLKEMIQLAFDTKDELIKIFEATKDAKDLTLYLRIFVSNEHSEIDLSKKFGASPTEAINLIKLARPLVKKLGVSFHVGSQCMHPVSYSKGIKEIGNIILKSGITPDIINVGGGFPSKYPDLYPQPLENYMEEIKKAKVLDSTKMPLDVIRLNSVVTIKTDFGGEKKFQLVIPTKSDLSQNKLSVMAPMGLALFGYAENDEVKWEFPSGLNTIKITKVEQPL